MKVMQKYFNLALSISFSRLFLIFNFNIPIALKVIVAPVPISYYVGSAHKIYILPKNYFTVTL